MSESKEPVPNVLTKSELMKEILVTEHLIDTYSRIDAERVGQLETKLKDLEYKLLDMMSAENEDWVGNVFEPDNSFDAKEVL